MPNFKFAIIQSGYQRIKCLSKIIKNIYCHLFSIQAYTLFLFQGISIFIQGIASQLCFLVASQLPELLIKYTIFLLYT